MEKQKKLGMSFLHRLIYGSGNLAANMMNCTVNTYISYYYTEVAGLPIAAAGVIFLLCRILDGVSDLVMGAIVENTHSKYGKARPWLLRMAIPYGLAIFLMFFSPNWGVTGKIVYAAAMYIAGIAIVYTMISVPYNTLSALITTDQDERTSLATMRQFFGFVGPLAITAVSLPIVNALGGGQAAWSILTAIYGVIGAALYLLVFFTTKELETEPVEKKTKEKKEKGATLKGIKALFQNKYWIMVLMLSLLLFLYWGVNGGVQVYYCKYVLGDDNLYSLISMASRIPTIILCFCIPALAKKYGKRNLSLLGCIVAAIGNLLMLLNPENLTVILAAVTLNTIGMSPISICVFAMLGDTATYGEWKTNVKNEGLIFCAMTFSEKVGYALGSALAAFALTLSGFVGNAVMQSASVISTMKICMIGGPVIAGLIMALVLKCYKLDDEYPMILKELEARRQADGK